ncbi:hypothetical protein MSPP1_001138 [Malassezia sp. CBS 17886]|nr:hypothetical protein MSPP1_001138 [Malassezia sp. CBS 17886]
MAAPWEVLLSPQDDAEGPVPLPTDLAGVGQRIPADSPLDAFASTTAGVLGVCTAPGHTGWDGERSARTEAWHTDTSADSAPPTPLVQHRAKTLVVPTPLSWSGHAVATDDGVAHGAAAHAQATSAARDSDLLDALGVRATDANGAGADTTPVHEAPPRTRSESGASPVRAKLQRETVVCKHALVLPWDKQGAARTGARAAHVGLEPGLHEKMRSIEAEMSRLYTEWAEITRSSPASFL